MAKDLADLKGIYSQFKKDELLQVAAELELKITPEVSTRQITQMVISNIEEEGVPEMEGISDILAEFLHVSGFIDEDGNIIEEEESAEDEEETIEEIPDWMCFGYADSRDPACGKCKLYDRCKTARIANRPECFGISYNENAPECKECIEAPFCKKELQKQGE